MIGLILGNRYEIIEEIGKGGMAHVYKAHCNLLNRMVAIKVLRQDLEEDSDFLRRFNTEAQAAASLVHPNIVSIFDFGYDQGYHYIVMEYIEGISLKQYIQEKAPLDMQDALSIAYQICDALSAAHEKNIVHRDIKPHNIMITNDHRVKVTDFGIARATTGSTMTADTNILGSVHYISPEQARGGHVDGKSDLYSLGIVVYEMLTGRLPFESDSPVAIAMKHIQEDPVSPREYNPEITPSVEKFILKAISKNISDRYQNANNMKDDIKLLEEDPNAEIGTAISDIYDDTDSDRTMIISKDKVNETLRTAPEVQRNTPAEKHPGTTARKADKPKESKKVVIGAIATAFVIVGLLSLLATYIIYPDAPIFSVFSSDEILVPSFKDKTLDEAKKLAEEKNLKVEVKDEVQDDTAEEGTIIGQTPGEGRHVKPESTIYLTVSVGAEKIKVDDFALSKYDAAKAALKKAGFNVETEFEDNDDVPENYVIRQKPDGGSEAAKGSTVTLYVSKGPSEKDVVVPKFVGKTLDEAKKSITDAGLTLGDVSYENSVVDSGLVIKQSVAGGETVSNKTKINLVVSSGEGSTGSNDTKHEATPTDRTIKCTIPADKETVTVKVTEGGKTVYEGAFHPQENPEFSLKVSGTGKKTYEVYADDTLVNTATISFTE